MRARALRAADYRRMRWKNGGGWTTELGAASAADGTFDWRVSIAEIESDGAFSTFPGCDRYIALLDGNGMQLDFADAAPAQHLERRLRFVKFSGDWNTHGRLLGGAVRDFNLIVRRGAVDAEILHRPLVGPMVFLCDAAITWFIYLVGGQALLKDQGVALEAGESLLLEPGGERENLVLSGGGEVVLIKLARVSEHGAAADQQ